MECENETYIFIKDLISKGQKQTTKKKKNRNFLEHVVLTAFAALSCWCQHHASLTSKLVES